MRIEQTDVVPAVDLVSLYTAVGWQTYVGEPDLLVAAVDNSDFVATAVVTDSEGDERLVGLIRVLTDSVSIAFIQDLLVHPEFQRQGIGTSLIKTVLARYDGIRRFALLTDTDPGVAAFYAGAGFTLLGNRGGGGGLDLVSFVRS